MKTFILLISIFICFSFISAQTIDNFSATYSSSGKTSLSIKNELDGDILWILDANVQNGDFFIRTIKSGSDDHSDASVTFTDATDPNDEGLISLLVVEADNDDSDGSFSIQSNKFLTIFSAFGLLFVFFAQGSSTSFGKFFKIGCYVAFLSAFVFVYAGTNVAVQIEIHVPATGSIWNNIEFEAENGDISLSIIQAKDYNIKTEKGSITGAWVQAIDTEDLTIHTEKGDIAIAILDAVGGDDDNEMLIQTDNGDVVVNANYITFNGEFLIKVKEGGANFTAATTSYLGKELSTDSSSGEITGEFQDPDNHGPQDLTVRSNKGDAALHLVEGVSPFKK